MAHYAVLIGNSEFPNERSLKPLTCPPADVEGMKMVLTAENRGQFLADHVLVLLNKESREVMREINRVLKNASKHDLVLFYYSGHGLPNSQNNLFLSTLDTEADLLESTAVSFNQVYELINTFYCKKIVIILDCCYSGAAGKVFKGDIGSQLQTLNSRATGTFLITATSEIQVALDVNEGSRFSLFTKHLIEGLESGAAAKNDEGLISVDDLFRYVSKKLSFENAKQVPRKFGKNESGELFIAKSGRDAKKEQLFEIKTYFSTLFAHHQIGQDTFIEVTQLLDKARFSDSEQQQYDLIVEVFETKKLAGFERKWDRLLLEIEKEQEKLAREKAEIEKKLVEEKSAKEKNTGSIKNEDDFKKGFKYAILVGNSQFPEEINLPYLDSPENDVDGLEEALTAENVGFEVITLKNKAHYEVEGVLQNTVMKLKADDVLLFHYSGQSCLNDKGELYLATLNTERQYLESSAIAMNRLYTIINSNFRRKNIVIILDCCFSGAAGNHFSGAMGNFYLLTCCTKTQLSIEKDSYGLFTKHLIYGLTTGQADINCDGWIDIDEWFEYASNHVIEENSRQSPVKFVANAVGKLLIAKAPTY